MSDVKALEEQLKLNKAQVEKAAVIGRLLKNHDFRTIILEDFCEKEIVRNMNMAGDAFVEEPVRKGCLEASYAPGHLKRYLKAQLAMGQAAEHGIPGLEADIEEARAEEDAE